MKDHTITNSLLLIPLAILCVLYVMCSVVYSVLFGDDGRDWYSYLGDCDSAECKKKEQDKWFDLEQ